MTLIFQSLLNLFATIAAAAHRLEFALAARKTFVVEQMCVK